MIRELRPLGLVDAAKFAKVDPFELIRIEVGLGTQIERLAWSKDRLAVVARDGGIEAVWLDPAKMPTTAAGRIREAFGELVRRGFVGTKPTRVDNLTRGLPLGEGDRIRRAAPLMADEGFLLMVSGPLGALVAVRPGMESQVSAIAAGTAESRALRDAMAE